MLRVLCFHGFINLLHLQMYHNFLNNSVLNMVMAIDI